MSSATITLAVDHDILDRAQRVAAAGGNDLHDLLRSVLAGLAGASPGTFDESKLPPITRRALGFARGSGAPITNERAAIEEALEEKYGMRK